jgi:hypothetical protein
MLSVIKVCGIRPKSEESAGGTNTYEIATPDPAHRILQSRSLGDRLQTLSPAPIPLRPNGSEVSCEHALQ